MPKVIADFLEGQVAGDKMGSAGVAQRVRPIMRPSIPDLDQAGAGQMMEGARRQRAPRRPERHEDFPSLTSWPDVPEISNQDRSEGLGKRIDLRAVLLGTCNRHLPIGPIELIKAQGSDFRTAQPVESEEH